jgi:hypothetical protein
VAEGAREEAWRAYRDRLFAMREDTERGPLIPAAPSWADWHAGFAAGVAEGIRLVREEADRD